MSNYEEKWFEMRRRVEALASGEFSDGKVSSVIIGGVAKVVYGAILKEMDLIENGFAECDKCGCKMFEVKSTVCEDCAKKMIKESEFKDFFDL